VFGLARIPVDSSPALAPESALRARLWKNMRVLVVASKIGYQTQALAEAGRRLGFDVQLATDRCHHLADPWGDGALSIDFDHPEPLDGDGQRFDGILAAGDAPAAVASVIAAGQGIPFHPPAAVAIARNKYEARLRFAAAGLPVPRFRRVPLDAPVPADRYPVVLKPLGLSASRGVIRADNVREFHAAFARIRALLERPEIRQHRQEMDRFIQVEEFIPGREYALEGLMTNGKLQIVAIFDKPDPLDGPFFEESIYVAPSRAADSEQAAMLAAVDRAVKALGLTHGPVHAEVRVNSAGVWMLEVAPRPIGGLCARALRFASGWSWEEVLLRHAVGEHRVEDEKLRAGGSAVMMIPIPKRGIFRGVSGVEEALATEGIEGLEVTAMPGNELTPLPEGASYLGFLFAHGKGPAEAEAALRAAHGKLRIHVSDILPQI
jgi:biotin carboxylase